MSGLLDDDDLATAVGRALGTVADGVEPSARLERRVQERVRARRRRPRLVGAGGVAVVAVAAGLVVPRLGTPDPATVTAGPAASTASDRPGPAPADGPVPTTSAPVPTTVAVAPPVASAPTTAAPPTTLAAAAPAGPCLNSASGRATVLASALPHRYITTQGFSDGRHGYLLGGSYEASGGVRYSDEIVRFDPATGEVRTLAARLPSPMAYAATVWDGAAAYLLGGYTQADGYWSGIVRFVPATGEVRVLGERLPAPLANAAGVWAGSHAYLFGGGGDASGGDYYSNRIYRFTPATGEVRLMGARLPKAGWNMAAHWNGRQVVVAGGNSGGYAFGDSDAVVSYDPGPDTVRSLGALPAGRSGASLIGVCDGRLLVVGGSYADGAEVLRFDAATGRSTVVGALPAPKQHGLVFTDGAATWLLGASVPAGPTTADASDEIVRFGP